MFETKRAGVTENSSVPTRNAAPLWDPYKDFPASEECDAVIRDLRAAEQANGFCGIDDIRDLKVRAWFRALFSKIDSLDAEGQARVMGWANQQQQRLADSGASQSLPSGNAHTTSDGTTVS